jgi:hypothetical protein
MSELPEGSDGIESRPASRRPWVAPALALESVDHTNTAKPVFSFVEENANFGPAS